jgi:ubiquinone/menaquinone biosynthesis C-methylase UbiE
MGAARKAKRVFAVELYASAVSFGKSQLQLARITNVHYIDGDREHLPLPGSSVDVAINSWAELNPHEAYRVLKPKGYLIQLGAIPTGLCGELTAELMSDYSWIPKECAPAEVFEPEYPGTSLTADNSIWNGIPVIGPIQVYQFTYVADYLDYTRAIGQVSK